MKLYLEITGGLHDNDLDEIVAAVNARRKALAPHHSPYEFTIGDRVQFTDAARPQYIIGAIATVTGYTRTKITVKFDRTIGRFRANSTITTPIGIVKKI